MRARAVDVHAFVVGAAMRGDARPWPRARRGSTGAPSSCRMPWMPHMALRPRSAAHARRAATRPAPSVDLAHSARRCAPRCARSRRSGAPARGCAASRRAARAPLDRRRQRAGVAGREQEAGLAVADQLAVAADVGGDEHAALRHRLQRLQRRDEFGQPHRQARIGQHVDQLVVALHLGVRHAAGEHDAVGKPGVARPARCSACSCGPPPTSSTRSSGCRGASQRDGLEQQVSPS